MKLHYNLFMKTINQIVIYILNKNMMMTVINYYSKRNNYIYVVELGDEFISHDQVGFIIANKIVS